MSPDLQAVLGACEELYAPTSASEFSERLLAVMKRLIPSAYYSWEMLDAAEIRSISARCEDMRGPVDWSHVADAYRHYTWQHPFAAAALGSSQAQVVTRSELLPDSRWERTDFYNLVLQPLGVKDQLCLTFRGAHAFGALVLHQDKDVSERSHRVLRLLAPHIQQAMNASFHWDVVVKARAGGSRYGRIVVNFDGYVEEIEPAALALLRYYFPVEVFGQALPPSVHQWFEGAVRAMWSPSEPAAVREGSVVTRAGRLRLTLLTQFAARQHIILFAAEHGLTPGGREAQEEALASLTPREREVLGWIAEGKRNGEIAVILGTSVSTVKSQVENILRKLGAETRGAAAATWRAQRR